MSRRSGGRDRRFSGSANVFTPRALTGLAFWLRADMGITLNGSNVSAWNDSSGTGVPNKNCTQATPSAQPAYNASDAAYNGKPTLSFVRTSSQCLNSGSWSLSQPFTIFVAGNVDASGATETLFASASGGAVSLTTNNGGTGPALFAGSFLQSGNSDISDPMVMAGVYNGASSKLFISNALVSNTGASGANNIAEAQIGNVSASQFLNGKIAEVIVYNRALSDAEVGVVVNYLMTRYGMAWTPRQLPNLTLWLRADKNITLNSGNVSNWNDSSGVGDVNRNATQGTANQQPVFQSSNPTFGGQPTVNFQTSGGVGQNLKTGTWGAPTVSSNATVAVACCLTNTSGGSNRYMFDSLSSAVQFAFYGDTSSPANGYGYNTGTGNYLAVFPIAEGSLKSLIIKAQSGSVASLYLNSSTDASSTHVNPGAFTPAGMTIGSYAGGGPYSDWQIGEFCVWLRQLSATEIALVNGYYSKRYGMTIT